MKRLRFVLVGGFLGAGKTTTLARLARHYLGGKVGLLQEQQRPDVILAEPVGSCTDLVATVVQPLRHLYGDRFEVGPYPVLFKPSHGLRILRNEAGGGVS